MSRSLIARSVRPLALLALLALAAAPFLTVAKPAATIADHPDKLKFEKLKYVPPKPADYRHALQSGATAYVAENHEVPTFQLTIIVQLATVATATCRASSSHFGVRMPASR